MTEIQNNDLVSKLWAASPVEPTQVSQINLSDSEEKVSPVETIPSNEEKVVAVSTSQVNIWADISEPAESTINNATTPIVDAPVTEPIHNESTPPNSVVASNVVSTNNITNNNSVTNSVTPAADVKVWNVVSNSINPNPLVNTWAVAGNPIDKVVNTNSQKLPSITKRNPRTEYWKWLASGVLVSIWLVVIGLVLFDNGSLLTSAANGIKLTNDDAANEVVKMEDALAFSDSLSNSYVDDIIGSSENEDANISNDFNAEIENQDSENENINSDEILENESNLDDTLVDSEENDEESDDNDSILVVEKSDDEVSIVTKNDLDEEDSSLNTDKKSNGNTSKNKMAGSIVSIFDDAEENLEADEIEGVDSDEDTSISYEHVNKVEDANWVISANCDNLHCGDISEANLDDLVLCTEFRQSDKLDDNSNRIGSNWVCRYKDVSELVHIEKNQEKSDNYIVGYNPAS